MLSKLIQGEHLLVNVEANTWEELVDITCEPLLRKGLVEPGFLRSVKETVEKYGAYMVLIDDIAFFHGRPESGVNELCMTLALLKKPVYLIDKRVKAAFMFAALNNDSHRDLLKILAKCMNNDSFVELLLNGAEPEAIMNKLREVEDEVSSVLRNNQGSTSTTI